MQTSLLSGLAALAFTFFTLRYKNKTKKHFAFALLSFVIFFWEISFFLLSWKENIAWHKIYLVGAIFLGPAFLYFNLLYLKVVSDEIKRVTSIYYSIGVFLFLSIFAPLHLLNTFKVIAYFYLGISVLAILYLVFQNLKASKTPGEFKRMKYLFAGLSIVIFTVVGDFVSKMGIPFPSLGNIVLILYLYFLFQSLTLPRPLDISEYLSRGVLFVILAVILSLIYFLLVSWVPESSWTFVFNTFCASFVIIIIYDKLKMLAEKITKKLIFKETYELEKKVNNFKENLLSILEVDQLLKTLSEFLHKSLNATTLHVYIFNKESQSLKKLLGSGTGKDKYPEVMEHHFFPENVNHMKTEINTLDTLKVQSHEEKIKILLPILKDLGAEVIWPFNYKDKVLGFCLFSNENSLERYPDSVLNFLSPLIPSLGFTLENIAQPKLSKVIPSPQAELSHESLRTLVHIKSLIAEMEKEPHLSHNMKSLLATLKTQVQKCQPP